MTFIVTIPMRFAQEFHPVDPALHPDGAVQVTAPDEETARRLTDAVLGTTWAFMYPADDFDLARWAPRGIVYEITAGGAA